MAGMSYRDLFELGSNRKSVIRTKGEKEADTRWNQSVMSRPDTGPGWVPEYVREPGLEAPMFSPDDLIGSGIGKAALALGKMASGAVSGAAAGLPMLAGIGHTVFHGSPHRFTKFDKARMGTGEGNQAFGKGMYVAENPAVAESYRNAGLSVVPDNASYGGRKIQSLYDAAQRKQDLGHRTKNKAMIDDANAELYFWESILTGTHPNIVKSNALDPDNGWPGLAKFASALDDRKFKGIAFPESSLYKVDIPDEAVPRMLDWEAAIRDQPPDVLAALKRVGVAQPEPAAREAIDAAKAAFNADKTRENYMALQGLINQGQNLTGKDIIKNRLASEADLENAGITGIRYLDADSRAGGGTRNMVVFNPDLMRILERNGEPTGLQPWGPGEWQGGSTLADLAKAAREPTEFELRHATAQRNAALPVDQGGLGLPPNNTAMDRARAMGAVDVYHGTNDDIGSISMDFSGAKTGNPNAALGFFTTPNPSEASRYATGWGKEGANVMPLMALPKSTYQMPFKELDDLAMLPYRKMMADPAYDPNRVVKFGDMTAQKEAAERMDRWNAEARSDVLRKRDEIVGGGFDSAVVNKGKPTEEFIALDPSIIRSRFAAFDPMRRHEADMMGFADPRLLAGMAVGGGAMMGYDPSFLPDSFREFASTLRRGR